MKILLLIFIFVFSSISTVIAKSKYLCTGKSNQFFLYFNLENKTVILSDNNPKKYWTEAEYIFWNSANDYTVYEYTFKIAYNKLSGSLKVKSHHLVTSKNIWYDYECSISK
tara:strand:+ start:224 stop:556 length:333 start_codon:yes stop_codon:yes gene_type:complete